MMMMNGNENERKRVQVFLGGSCNPTRWRMDIAIPFLEKYGITYYNPQVDQWIPEMIEMERKAKDDARILFFVIDDQTRSIVSMIEVAYLVGIRRMRKRLILTINDFSITSTNILMTNELEMKRLNKGHCLLRTLFTTSNLTFHSNLMDSLNYLIHQLFNGSMNRDPSRYVPLQNRNHFNYQRLNIAGYVKSIYVQNKIEPILR